MLLLIVVLVHIQHVVIHVDMKQPRNVDVPLDTAIGRCERPPLSVSAGKL